MDQKSEQENMAVEERWPLWDLVGRWPLVEIRLYHHDLFWMKWVNDPFSFPEPLLHIGLK